jgi:hypothetical protein
MHRLFIYEVVIAIMLFMAIKTCKAYSYELLEPKSVMIEGEYFDSLKDPYIRQYDKSWTYGAALATQLTLVGQIENRWRLFYDPKLSFRSTTSQIREGHLNYELGGEIFVKDRGFRVFRYHESRHALDANESERNYPLTDSYKIQLIWEINK